MRRKMGVCHRSLGKTMFRSVETADKVKSDGGDKSKLHRFCHVRMKVKVEFPNEDGIFLFSFKYTSNDEQPDWPGGTFKHLEHYEINFLLGEIKGAKKNNLERRDNKKQER